MTGEWSICPIQWNEYYANVENALRIINDSSLDEKTKDTLEDLLRIDDISGYQKPVFTSWQDTVDNIDGICPPNASVSEVDWLRAQAEKIAKGECPYFDWDKLFAEVEDKEKRYLNTDGAPWLTETYTEDEKKLYPLLKCQARRMPNEKLYMNLGTNRVWTRVVREETNFRVESKGTRKPKNPIKEYYEPTDCPWCGREELKKTEDGNYRCMHCGYDHNAERNFYNWTVKG